LYIGLRSDNTEKADALFSMPGNGSSRPSQCGMTGIDRKYEKAQLLLIMDKIELRICGGDGNRVAKAGRSVRLGLGVVSLADDAATWGRLGVRAAGGGQHHAEQRAQ
jgi:hypothetical protein